MFCFCTFWGANPVMLSRRAPLTYPWESCHALTAVGSSTHRPLWLFPTPGLLLSFLCSFSRAAGGRVRVAGIALIGLARLPSWSTGTSRLSSNYFVFQCCLSYQGRWAYAIEDGSFLSGARAALTYPSFWYVVRCPCPLCCLILSIYRFVFARGVAISYTSRHTAPCPCPNRRASTHEPRMCSPCYCVL